MIAVDSGFLFALLDRRDAWHRLAAALAGTAAEGWITTWPVLSEACLLIHRSLDSTIAVALMEDVADGGISIWNPPREQFARLPGLMRKYAKLPMDLADASLILLAEHLGHGQIISTDQRDFGTFRWKSRKPFHNLLQAAP